MARISDIADLVDKMVTVQVDISRQSEDEDFREVNGKLLAVSPNGLVIQNKTGTEIIGLADLLDIEETPKQLSLHIVRRWVKPVTPGSATGTVIKRWVEEEAMPSVRQHLADRHGVPLDLIKAATPEAALMLHDGIDHKLLGHEHGVKPPGTRGRKPKDHNGAATDAPKSDTQEDQ